MVNTHKIVQLGTFCIFKKPNGATNTKKKGYRRGLYLVKGTLIIIDKFANHHSTLIFGS